MEHTPRQENKEKKGKTEPMQLELLPDDYLQLSLTYKTYQSGQKMDGAFERHLSLKMEIFW